MPSFGGVNWVVVVCTWSMSAPRLLRRRVNFSAGGSLICAWNSRLAAANDARERPRGGRSSDLVSFSVALNVSPIAPEGVVAESIVTSVFLDAVVTIGNVPVLTGRKSLLIDTAAIGDGPWLDGPEGALNEPIVIGVFPDSLVTIGAVPVLTGWASLLIEVAAIGGDLVLGLLVEIYVLFTFW